MNKKLQKKEIPIGHQAACEALRTKFGHVPRSYQNLSYRLLGVNNIVVEECYAIAKIRNPANRDIYSLLEPRYISTRVRDLSNLYVDDEKQGKLYGGSSGKAAAIQQMLMLSEKPVDLLIRGHFTESVWYIDSIKVINKDKED